MDVNNKKTREFSWPVRVYYEDTDSGGVVYYANYLKFMERARTELLRDLGFEQNELQQESGIVFAVHNVNIQYKKPARFNDELKVITSITPPGKASIHFKQQVYHKSEQLLAEATIKIACLNAATFTPCSIPFFIIKKIQQEYFCGS